MTLTATAPAPSRGRLSSWGGTFALSFLILVAFWSLIGLHEGPVEMMVMGNDAGMRLLTLRDLMAGQGWFDAMQPRLGPEGTLMHWSRLVDAPMLAVVLAFEPFLGREGAEVLLLFVWPLTMLSAVIATAASIARRLGNGLSGWLMVTGGLFALVVRWRFMPGDIDHHNVQVLLLLLAFWGALARHDHPLAAPGAGLAIAASLCVGVETLPLLVLIGLGLSGLWAARGIAERSPALGFAAGLGGGLAVLFPATAPTIAWRGGFCDAISVDLAGPVLAGTALLAGLAWTLSSHSVRIRTGALVGGGVVLAGAVAAFLPTCLSNPYDALDPYLVENWLNLTNEAVGFVEGVSKGRYVHGIVVATALVSAFTAPLLIGARALPLTALLLMGVAIGFYQVRGMFPLFVLALIAASVVAGLQRTRAQERADVRTQGLAVVLLVGFALASVLSGVGSGFVEKAHTRDESDDPGCLGETAFATLATLPRGQIAAFSDMGVPILLATDHDVLAAPYHRNQAGLRAALEIVLAATDAEGEAAMRRSGADYLVICPTDGDIEGYGKHAGDILATRIAAGRVPAFLRPVPGTETQAVRIFTLR